MVGRGTGLFRAVCDNHLEEIVANCKYGAYVFRDRQPPDRRLALHATIPTPRRG